MEEPVGFLVEFQGFMIINYLVEGSQFTRLSRQIPGLQDAFMELEEINPKANCLISEKQPLAIFTNVSIEDMTRLKLSHKKFLKITPMFSIPENYGQMVRDEEGNLVAYDI